MPVEIRELVIRATIVQNAEEDESKSQTLSQAVDQEAIVQECVRQVMNILKKKEER